MPNISVNDAKLVDRTYIDYCEKTYDAQNSFHIK